MTSKDVSEKLGVSIETVWRWIRENKLEAIALSGSQAQRKEYRINQSQLDAFLNDKEKKNE